MTCPPVCEWLRYAEGLDSITFEMDWPATLHTPIRLRFYTASDRGSTTYQSFDADGGMDWEPDELVAVVANWSPRWSPDGGLVAAFASPRVPPLEVPS